MHSDLSRLCSGTSPPGESEGTALQHKPICSEQRIILGKSRRCLDAMSRNILHINGCLISCP